jgi:ATP-dependent DNA helicase RecG
MTDAKPHQVVGTDFAEGKEGALEDEIYERLKIRVPSPGQDNHRISPQ